MASAGLMDSLTRERQAIWPVSNPCGVGFAVRTEADRGSSVTRNGGYRLLALAYSRRNTCIASAASANTTITAAKTASAIKAPASVEMTPIPITGNALPEKPQMK